MGSDTLYNCSDWEVAIELMLRFRAQVCIGFGRVMPSGLYCAASYNHIIRPILLVRS
jgi:hypothetical protein